MGLEQSWKEDQGSYTVQKQRQEAEKTTTQSLTPEEPI